MFLPYLANTQGLQNAEFENSKEGNAGQALLPLDGSNSIRPPDVGPGA